MDAKLPCVCCRKSLNRIGGAQRRSFALTTQFMQDNLFLWDYFVEVANIQGTFSPLNRICRPCFQRAQRYVKVKQQDGQIIKEEPAVEIYHIAEYDCQSDALKQELPVPINQVDYIKADTILSDDSVGDQNHEPDALKQETTTHTHFGCQPIKQDSTSYTESQNIIAESHESVGMKQEAPTFIERAVQANEPQMMLISGYSRVPLNTHMCIMKSCNNRNLQRINVGTRTAILQKNSLFIPHGARVCDVHEEQLFAAAWQELAELKTRQIHTEFTSQHISDMLNLLRVHHI